MILQEAIRNLVRSPRRSATTALTLGGSTVLLCLLLALQEGTYETLLGTVLGNSTGAAQISARGFEPEKDFDRLIDPATAGSFVVAGVPTAPRLHAQVLLTGRGRGIGASLVSVDSAREAEVGLWTSSAKAGLPGPGDHQGVVLGAALSRALDARAGDTLQILGQGLEGQIASGEVVVRGTLETGVEEIDGSAALVSFAAADRIFATGDQAHVLVLGMKGDPWWAPEFLRSSVGALPDELEALPWQDLMPDLEQAIEMDRASNMVFYATLVLVVALSAANSWTISVHERRRLNGILVAIGTPCSRLWAVMVAEAAALSTAAVLSGCLVAVPLLLWARESGVAVPGAEMFARWGLPPRLHPSLRGEVVLGAAGVVWTLSFLSGVVCSLGVLRASPRDGVAG